MNANNRQALYSSQIKQIEEELTPFGFFDSGVPEEHLPQVMDGDIWFTDGYQKDLKDFSRESQW
jgi:hypothetical protein